MTTKNRNVHQKNQVVMKQAVGQDDAVVVLEGLMDGPPPTPRKQMEVEQRVVIDVVVVVMKPQAHIVIPHRNIDLRPTKVVPKGEEKRRVFLPIHRGIEGHVGGMNNNDLVPIILPYPKSLLLDHPPKSIVTIHPVIVRDRMIVR